jgi:hypothetical protein
MKGRIGFCCKWLNDPTECGGMKVNAKDRDINGRSTTMRWLREHADEADQRQWDIMNHNAAAALKMVERVGSMPEHLRMVRLGSEMLQGYTEPSWIDWWQRVLASENDGIVERSILEFEYHADMARWMGYGAAWHDHGFKINVHLSGKGGPEKFLRTLDQLSPEARNLIAIENDEMSNGLDVTLAVADRVALVLDIHHHWINSGEYIDPVDSRVQRVIESWRGVRPACHYSVSREDILVDHDARTRPDLADLLAKGYKKQKLRAHSDFYWNSAVNDWAAGFIADFDIQCEAKGKNLARDGFAQQALA